VLGLGAAAVASTVFPAGRAQAAYRRPAAQPAVDALRPTIRPRSDWAGDLGVNGELVAEDDVRFLLVHHTASTNDYGPDEVVDQIRGFYQFHTGPEKGWPDVAYNFFVDRYGGIWEARAGSLDGPIRGDATGGSQGFALLCSLIGNHVEAPMTAEAERSLVALLAWLGERYAVDTAPGAKVSFVSRGSSRWPAGTEVTAATISGHRDMSTTTCPGDFVYDLLAQEIPAQVSELRVAVAGPAAAASSSTDPEATTRSTTEPEPATSSSDQTATSAATDGSEVVAGGGDAAGSERVAAAVEAPADGEDRSWPLIILGGLAGAVAVAGGAINRLRTRAQRSG